MKENRNMEMIKAYLERDGASYEVQQIGAEKFKVKDVTVLGSTNEFYLKIKDGRIICDGQDCIENAKSTCSKDDYMQQTKLQSFECQWYHAWDKPDDLQWTRKISNDEWEFVEGRYAEDGYLLVSGSVCLRDWLDDNGNYDDSCKEIIKAFYGNIEDFKEAYTDETVRKQVLAEMLFEETPYFELSWKMVAEDKIEDAIEKRKEELGKVI